MAETTDTPVREALPRVRDLQEDEANIFAAYLLMPPDMFEAECERAGLKDALDEPRVAEIARRFKVPMGAVILRMSLGAE